MHYGLTSSKRLLFLLLLGLRLLHTLIEVRDVDHQVLDALSCRCFQKMPLVAGLIHSVHGAGWSNHLAMDLLILLMWVVVTSIHILRAIIASGVECNN